MVQKMSPNSIWRFIFERPQLRFSKIAISLFLHVALWAASILKIRVFSIYSIFFKLQNLVICSDLSLGSMLDSLVLKNAVECASQRLKWTSGASVMVMFGYRKSDRF